VTLAARGRKDTKQEPVGKKKKKKKKKKRKRRALLGL
jgi:hypothetical protein